MQFRPMTKMGYVSSCVPPSSFPHVPVSLLAHQTFRSLKRKASLPQRILFPFGNQWRCVLEWATLPSITPYLGLQALRPEDLAQSCVSCTDQEQEPRP